MEVVPVNIGLKYKPPKLGVQYHMKDQPNAHFVHEIPLSFVQRDSNLDLLTKDIFEKHRQFLNPKVVPQTQIRRLLEKFVTTLYGHNIENIQHQNIIKN